MPGVYLDVLNLSNWFMRGCVYIFLSFIMYMGDQVTILAGFSLMCSGTHPAGALARHLRNLHLAMIGSGKPHGSALTLL